MDAEPARLVGTGGNHPALVRPCADNDGLAAPLGVVTLLHGREERVHVHVQYACSVCRHAPIIAYFPADTSRILAAAKSTQPNLSSTNCGLDML